jgi:glycosyltransferase involved in cell wall biosynthesis
MVESMALKKPIIGSNIGGIPEVVVDNETGLIFEAGDFNDLKKCFSYFNENRNQIISMGEKGYARQHSIYKLEEYQKKHEKYFNSVKNEHQIHKN